MVCTHHCLTMFTNTPTTMQAAIECDAKDATSMHLLGQWCFSVVTIPWYQRQIASVLFATPPQSTIEEVCVYVHSSSVVDYVLLCIVVLHLFP